MEKQNHCRLDRPVWHALSTKQSALGQGGALARRYHADVAPFADVENTTLEAFQSLMTLIPQGEFAFLPALTQLPPMDGIHHEHVFSVIQMIDRGNANEIHDDDVVALGTADVPDMLALAERTRPGPFGKRTIAMGHYLGMHVKDNNQTAIALYERMGFEARQTLFMHRISHA